MEIREFRQGDGDMLRTFWLACGITIRPGDDDQHLLAFAARNPGLFLIAFEGEARIVGCVLAGWDGRRAMLYHAATHPDERRRGIGRTLVARVEETLLALGCPRVTLQVEADNTWGMSFWEALGYRRNASVGFGKMLK